MILLRRYNDDRILVLFADTEKLCICGEVYSLQSINFSNAWMDLCMCFCYRVFGDCCDANDVTYSFSCRGRL